MIDPHDVLLESTERLTDIALYVSKWGHLLRPMEPSASFGAERPPRRAPWPLAGAARPRKAPARRTSSPGPWR